MVEDLNDTVGAEATVTWVWTEPHFEPESQLLYR